MSKFISSLSNNIKKNNKKIKILFTEGWNKKIQLAAIKLKNDGIIEPILLLKNKNNNKNIKDIKKIIISDIDNKKNIDKIYEIRKYKNISIEEAKKNACDPPYLSAVLLKRKIVDGVVCGIEYTTRETLKAAFQIVGKSKNYKLISSAMIMEQENKILIFGDCAINVNPNSEELANIAIDISKFSKNILGNKKINTALLSYSTNGSGFGESVDKVKESYLIIKKKKIKNINFFGEIQFDAAFDKKIRNKKIKDSKLNENANVFIFPNLDSGNIGYKIFERCSNNVNAIGPIIIGLKKPMNDLSRGSTLKSIIDISYVTAFQSIK